MNHLSLNKNWTIQVIESDSGMRKFNDLDFIEHCGSLTECAVSWPSQIKYMYIWLENLTGISLKIISNPGGGWWVHLIYLIVGVIQLHGARRVKIQHFTFAGNIAEKLRWICHDAWSMSERKGVNTKEAEVQYAEDHKVYDT